MQLEREALDKLESEAEKEKREKIQNFDKDSDQSDCSEEEMCEQ